MLKFEFFHVQTKTQEMAGASTPQQHRHSLHRGKSSGLWKLYTHL